MRGREWLRASVKSEGVVVGVCCQSALRVKVWSAHRLGIVVLWVDGVLPLLSPE